jgi:hypothetical protein
MWELALTMEGQNIWSPFFPQKILVLGPIYIHTYLYILLIYIYIYLCIHTCAACSCVHTLYFVYVHLYFEHARALFIPWALRHAAIRRSFVLHARVHTSYFVYVHHLFLARARALHTMSSQAYSNTQLWRIVSKLRAKMKLILILTLLSLPSIRIKDTPFPFGVSLII